jgi:Tol biopolymer transport system component
VLVLTLGLTSSGEAQERPQGPYLGQRPPGTLPEVFAPGIVSTDAHEFAGSFTPDGREFYFTRTTAPRGPTLIFVSRRVSDGWTEPEPATFNHPSAQMSFEAMPTPDGQRLYFSSDRPLDPGAAPGGPPTMNLWYVEREGDGWGEPRDAGPPFNPMRAMYLSMTTAGAIYTTDISDGMGRERIGVARPSGGSYGPIERLAAPVNGEGASMYPCVSSDDEYLVFTRRLGDLGSATGLYVSFRTPDGGWGEPVALDLGMPAGVPSLSPDGRYLFFTGGERGRSDIYWVSADIIENARH